MLTITIQVDAPGWTAQGIKEVLAMQLEVWGDTKVLEVKADKAVHTMDGQLPIEGGGD